ncbi:aspartyl protease family protein [Reichenbachiella sp. MALMAid0571]
MYNQTVIDEQEFSSTIQFKKLASGHIVIPVFIGGNEYSFLLDTGTPNMVSKELAEELKLEHVYHQQYIDSQDNKLALSLSVIDEIVIGGVSFRNNATTIHNFDKSPPTIRCLNISGVVGANLMKSAIWTFDFERNTITIANAKKEFPEGEVLNFKTGYAGTPKVKVNINGVSDGKAYIDFGAKGFYKTSEKTLHKLCRDKNKHKCSITSGHGSIASGAFGYEKPDSSHIALVHSFSIGNESQVALKNQLITMSNHSEKLLGLDCFENFTTTINWPERKLILSEKAKPEEIDSYNSFGFRVIYREEKLYVGFIYNNSPATKAGLLLGDQIVKINEFNFDHSNEDKFCSFLNSKTLSTTNQIKLTLLRNGQPTDIVLEKKDLFEGTQSGEVN